MDVGLKCKMAETRKNSPRLTRIILDCHCQAQMLPEDTVATDCKSLFDLVSRTAPPSCSEFRTQLNARYIKDLLAENVNLRWVHSGAQLADGLTKIMENSFLRETLESGKYRLNDELEILKARSDSRTRLKWLRSHGDMNTCNAQNTSRSLSFETL